MGKPTYRPRNKRRIRTHGFRLRMATKWGREVLSRRRKKGHRPVADKIRRRLDHLASLVACGSRVRLTWKQ